MRPRAFAALLSLAVLALAALPAHAADPRTRRMSVKNNGEGVPEGSDGYIDGLSNDGKLAAFASDGALVAADDNGINDVYLRNLRTGKTQWVSVDGDGDSNGAAVSGNGKFVVFWSEAENLVPNDPGADSDIFIYNVETKNIQLVSRNAVEVGSQPAVNLSGRFVAFDTESQLVNKDNNHVKDVYVRDRRKGVTRLISVDSNGDDTADGDSDDPSISANGRFVAFDSASDDLIPNDGNASEDVFRHDRKTGKTRRLSVKTNGNEESGQSNNPSMNADGSLVAFGSQAELTALGDNGSQDIYLRNVATGKTILLTKDMNGEPTDGDSIYSAISPNGRLVGFYSYATDFVTGAPADLYAAFVLDRKTGKIKLVDRKTSGTPGTERSYVTGISNGFVLFATQSALVGPDDNDNYDTYRRGPLN